MFKEVENFQDTTTSEIIQEEIIETTNNTSFHPIVGFFNYEELENNELSEDYPSDNIYIFPVLMYTEKKD